MEKVLYRFATEKDLEQIKGLNKELFKVENTFDKTLDMTWPDSQSADETFKWWVEGENTFLIVVEIDNKIIGYGSGAILDPMDWRIPKKIAELDNLVIAEEFRGKGIGTKILEMFEEWCREKNVDLMHIEVNTQNDKAINRYKKSGFTEYNLILEKPVPKER
jgi:ribosomal protein S18 acetylase RimI-like enzyme